jgi:hypothetical protein
LQRTLSALLRSHPGFPTLDDRNTRTADYCDAQ